MKGLIEIRPISKDEPDDLGIISSEKVTYLFYGRPAYKRNWTANAIRALALQLRRTLKIEKEFCPDLVFVLSEFRIVFSEFKWHSVPESKAKEALVWSDAAAKTIWIGDTVFRGLSEGEPWARMTLAHELGHLVLEHRERSARDGSTALAEKKWQEIQAHRFALEFLLPPKLAANCKSADEIAYKFKVSKDTARVRWSELIVREQNKKIRPRNEISYLSNKPRK